MNKLFLCFTAIALSFAQQAPSLQSPDVQSDGRVTFRFRDPNAQKVVVNIEGAKAPLVMEKDERGIWSATSGPLAADLYGYSFEADGVHLLDPFNTQVKPNLLNLNNVVHVPGASPLAWEMTDIPHGEIHHHFYKSATIGDNRDFYVYTPPRYDPRGETKYPVLYLLHGYSDDASAWTAVGKANLILDTLIEQGKAKPMIVVMPLGYGVPGIVTRTPVPNLALHAKNISNFRDALISEVIPAVEKMYKVSTDRDSRAIAGLSMGGAESLVTGLNRLDEFSWIGAFSSGGVGNDFASAFPDLSAAANQRIHLLWIACGSDDHLITPNRELVTWLKTKGVHLTQIETPGMHTWMVWRRNLMEFAPLLFRAGTGNVSAAIVPGER